MIRTVWFAAGCLVVLFCAMAAGKVAKAPAAQATDERPITGATVGTDLAQEPLIKADRLEVAYVRQENPSQSTLQPIDLVVPEVQKMISPAEANIVSRHWHDPNAINSSAAKSKRTTKNSKSAADSKESRAADHSRLSEQTKRCDRTAVLSGVLRSLNLAPACDS
jgi:hypothetical protein